MKHDQLADTSSQSGSANEIKQEHSRSMDNDEKLSRLDALSAGLYLATMTLMGAFIVSIAEGITDLAENCKSTATDSGTVFIAHGVGSVIGSLLGSPMYLRFNGDVVDGLSLLVLGIIAFGLPHVTTVAVLHVLYFLSGVAVGLGDTGANILISRLLGKRAGPWMIALQLGFNLGGFLGIFCAQMFTLDILSLLYSVGVLYLLWGSVGILLPALRMIIPDEQQAPKSKTDEILISEDSFKEYKDPQAAPKNLKMLTYEAVPSDLELGECGIGLDEYDRKFEDYAPERENECAIQCSDAQQEPPSVPHEQIPKKIAPNLAITPPNYYSEVLLSLVLLFIVGSGTSATAFLAPYATNTGLVSVSTASLQVSMIWLSMTVGLTFSLFLRKYFFSRDEDVPYLFCVFSIIAAVGALLMIAIPEKENHSSVLWLGLMLFGFFSKPCMGLVFQWIGSITYATETSFAIACVGLNLGSGIIPYITTAMWNYVDGATALFIVIFVSMLLTVPLFLGSSYVSCKKSTDLYV